MRPIRSFVPVLLAFALAACGGDAERITAASVEPSKVVLAPVCVYFDPPLFADSVGGPHGQVPGDLWFTENAIPVSLHAFHHPAPDPPSFGEAFVRPAFVAPAFGAGQIARTNNINLGFDFSGLTFVPSSVTFDWRDYGGHENLKVNGSGIFIGELTAAPSPIGGATVGHVWFWGGGGSFKQGTTTLTGPVTYLRVGGQEFFLDNVCANP